MENRTEKQTPATELKTVKTDIANLLGWFDCEMAKDQPATWGMVTQLESTRATLIDALSIMSGMDTETIKESLEESKQK